MVGFYNLICFNNTDYSHNWCKEYIYHQCIKKTNPFPKGEKRNDD